jgi:hypothetical protein
MVTILFEVSPMMENRAARTAAPSEAEPEIDLLIRTARAQIEGGDSKGWLPSSAVPALLQRGATVLGQSRQETGFLVHLEYDGVLMVTVVPVPIQIAGATIIH